MPPPGSPPRPRSPPRRRRALHRGPALHHAAAGLSTAPPHSTTPPPGSPPRPRAPPCCHRSLHRTPALHHTVDLSLAPSRLSSKPSTSPSLPHAGLSTASAASPRNGVTAVVVHVPKVLVLEVANPVDDLTYLASKILWFPASTVIGSGTNFHSSRFWFLINQHLTSTPRTCRLFNYFLDYGVDGL